MLWDIKGFLLLFIVTTTYSNCYEYNNLDESIECFISFLKQNNACDEFVCPKNRQVVNSMPTISTSCLRGVDLEKQKLLSQAHFQLRLKPSYECLQRATENDQHFLNLLLNLRVVKNFGESSLKKFNSMFGGGKTPKEMAVQRIESQLRDFLSHSEVKCDSYVDFGNLFDSLFEPSFDDFERYDDAQEYCIKQEVSAAVAHLNVDVNPKHLQIIDIDCEKIINLIKKETIDSLKDVDNGIRQSCIRSEMRESDDFFHNLLAVEFMSSLNLSADQQKREKKKFVDNMIDITLKVRERC